MPIHYVELPVGAKRLIDQAIEQAMSPAVGKSDDAEEVTSIWKPVSLSKYAMGRYVGTTWRENRPLKWIRFNPGSPLPVPDLMKDEIETLMADFRASFAPYAQTAATKAAYKNFNGMVFAWYAEDAAIGVDDMKGLKRDPTVDPDQKAKLKWLADFVQEKGIRLVPHGTTDDPSDLNYGNMSDLWFSDYGYAFNKWVKVKEGKASVPLKTTGFNDTNSADPWKAAFDYQQGDPAYYGRIFEVTVRPTSRGTNALFAHIRTPDGRGDKFVPVLAFSGQADIGDPDTYKNNYQQFLINQIVPGQSFVFMPDGPQGKIKLVAGTERLVNNLQKKQLHHWLDQYRNDDGSIRQAPIMNKVKELNDHLYRLAFDGPEGGLVIRNATGTFPLSASQVKSIINPGEIGNQYRQDGRKNLNIILPAKQPVDVDGNEKPAGFGPWEVAAADKEKLRSMFKPMLDKLFNLTAKYRVDRKEMEDEDSLGYSPAQHFVWVVVVPRFQDANVLPQGKAQGWIYNRKFMGPQEQPAAQQGDAAVVASSFGLTKEAIVYQPGKGERSWVVVTHDINPGKHKQVGGKRFPYEAMKGDSEVGFASAQEAVAYVTQTYQLSGSHVVPSAAKVQAAQEAFDAAKADIANMRLQPQETEEVAQEAQIRAGHQATKNEQPTQMQPHPTRDFHEVGQQDLPGLFDHLNHFEHVPEGRGAEAPQAAAAPKRPRKPRVGPVAPVPMQPQPGLFSMPMDPLAPSASVLASQILKKYAK